MTKEELKQIIDEMDQSKIAILRHAIKTAMDIKIPQKILDGKDVDYETRYKNIKSIADAPLSIDCIKYYVASTKKVPENVDEILSEICDIRDEIEIEENENIEVEKPQEVVQDNSDKNDTKDDIICKITEEQQMEQEPQKKETTTERNKRIAKEIDKLSKIDKEIAKYKALISKLENEKKTLETKYANL